MFRTLFDGVLTARLEEMTLAEIEREQLRPRRQNRRQKQNRKKK